MAFEENPDLYRKEWRWQEGDLTVTRTCHWSAPGCHDSCGVLLYTDKDGKLVKIEGDPNQTYNNGTLCMRCLNMVEAVNHPDRLKYPLKRAGERGENKWERISWDEALDIIEENVRRIQKEYGPESIVGMMGTGRNCNWAVPLITYAGFGSPNFALGFLAGDSCMLPRAAISAAVMGDLTVVDASQFRPDRYDNPEYHRPDYIFMVGNNALKSNGDGFLGHWIVELMKRGTKLIVCDPQLTWFAAKAEIWLQIRPGTDGALALSMINVIVGEDLYDHDYVDKWCYGFDQLVESVKDWSPEEASKVTWIPADDIRKAARLFAQGNPSALQWGVAVDMNVNGIPQAHAWIAMNAICGNIEKPGGNIVARDAYGMVLSYPYGYDQYVPAEMQAKRIGLDFSPLHRFAAGAATAHGDSLLQTIETGKPYPIKMIWFQSTNPIANMAGEAPRVYDAINKMDFVVVVDVFMTPTAVAFADVVLPAAMSCERNSIRGWWTPSRAITKCSSYYEAKSDEDIVVAVCSRLNPENFKPRSDIDLLDEAIENGFDDPPFTYAELTEMVDSWPERPYFMHEKGLLRSDGQPGFNTPTGRIELYSLVLEALGDPALPYYEEPPESPYSTPELAEEYPLVLTTGHRSYEFFHSEHRQQPTMREFHPWPLVEMHPETAKKYGVKDGDWVWIENARGRCRQVVHETETMDPRVVNAEHGWWFPEQEAAEPSLYGVFDSNINNLTNQCVTGPTGYGAPYKSQLCKVYKCTEENSAVMPSKQVTELGGFPYERIQYSEDAVHANTNEEFLGGRKYVY